MHVQYTMPGHRGSTEPQPQGGGRGGVGESEREDGSHYRARKTLCTCLFLARTVVLYDTAAVFDVS